MHWLSRWQRQGEANACPLRPLMPRQVDHATQDRSEVAVVLTAYGHLVRSEDMVIYLHIRSVQPLE